MHSMSSTVTSKSESVSKNLRVQQLLVSTSLAPVQFVGLAIQVCLFIAVCVTELINQVRLKRSRAHLMYSILFDTPSKKYFFGIGRG